MNSRAALGAGSALAIAALALSGCASSDPLAEEAPEGGDASGEIVVGSAAFAESEIIAYIYAGALNRAGVDASVTPAIGQRDVYVAALEDGSVDLVPDYTGNLLQFYDPEATASAADEVYEALGGALPEGLEVLDQAEAANADSYNVTREFSEEHGVTSLADLAGLDIDLTVAANPEFAERPYGIPGLKEVYGVDAVLQPINDGGGPNTLKALLDGDVQLADIYTTTPSITENDLVTLEDPENMIVAQNVVPLISSDAASDEVVEAIDAVQAELTTDDLVELNAQSTNDKLAAEDIAEGWLDDAGF